MEHAKVVDASNNNWNNRDARNFQDRIFDQVSLLFVEIKRRKTRARV